MNRGKPRDAVADAPNEIVEIGVLVLRDAVKHVLEQAPDQLPLSVLVTVHLADIMEQVVQAFEHGLPVAMKATKVTDDPARAKRSEPDAEPARTVFNDRLRSIETDIGDLLNPTGRKRGRPTDVVADALNEIGRVGVPALRDANRSVLRQVPPSIEVAAYLPGIMDQVVQAFEQRLVVAMKAGSTWHYETQRKVARPTRAKRDADRRRRKKTDRSG
jgi:hypothetical protein